MRLRIFHIFIFLALFSLSCQSLNDRSSSTILAENEDVEKSYTVLDLDSVKGKTIQETGVSFEEFRDLVKNCTERIPDLQRLWDWRREHNLKDVYLGGGVLRGLLVWMHKQLQTKSPEQLRKTPIPDMYSLLLVKNVDIDIMAPESRANIIKRLIPDFTTQDILSPEFYEAAFKNGGPTIDKIMASPGWVEDPYGALERFYEGKLDFHWTAEKAFRENSKTNIKNEFRMNLALRYLRFTIDMGSAAAPDPKSLELIAKIAKNEKKLIPEFSKEDWDKGWRIKKHLNKLYMATGDNMAKVILILRDAGLLKLLSEKGYKVTNYGGSNAATVVQTLRKAGMSATEMAEAESFISSMSVDPGLAARREWLKGVSSARDFIDAARIHFDPNKDYLNSTSDVVSKSVGYFYEHNPTPNEIKDLLKINDNYFLNVAVATHKKAPGEAVFLATIDMWEQNYDSKQHYDFCDKVFVAARGKSADWNSPTAVKAAKLLAEGAFKFIPVVGFFSQDQSADSKAARTFFTKYGEREAKGKDREVRKSFINAVLAHQDVLHLGGRITALNTIYKAADKDTKYIISDSLTHISRYRDKANQKELKSFLLEIIGGSYHFKPLTNFFTAEGAMSHKVTQEAGLILAKSLAIEKDWAKTFRAELFKTREWSTNPMALEAVEACYLEGNNEVRYDISTFLPEMMKKGASWKNPAFGKLVVTVANNSFYTKEVFEVLSSEEAFKSELGRQAIEDYATRLMNDSKSKNIDHFFDDVLTKPHITGTKEGQAFLQKLQMKKIAMLTGGDGNCENIQDLVRQLMRVPNPG